MRNDFDLCSSGEFVCYFTFKFVRNIGLSVTSSYIYLYEKTPFRSKYGHKFFSLFIHSQMKESWISSLFYFVAYLYWTFFFSFAFSFRLDLNEHLNAIVFGNFFKWKKIYLTKVENKTTNADMDRIYKFCIGCLNLYSNLLHIYIWICSPTFNRINPAR